MDIGQTQNESGRIKALLIIVTYSGNTDSTLSECWLSWMSWFFALFATPLIISRALDWSENALIPAQHFQSHHHTEAICYSWEQPEWIEKGNFQYYFAPVPLSAKFAFWLITQSSQGVIMQFSYLKHLFMRHFSSLPSVNQLFFHSPQLSTASVNRSAPQVNQLAL